VRELAPAFASGTISVLRSFSEGGCEAQSGGKPPHSKAPEVPSRTDCPGAGSTIQHPVDPDFNIAIITLNSVKFKWIQANSSKSSRGIPPFQSLSRRLVLPICQSRLFREEFTTDFRYESRAVRINFPSVPSAIRGSIFLVVALPRWDFCAFAR
jgi:hypothetical protein